MAKINLADRKINNLIKKTVIETLREVFQDPDYGLELQDWVKRRLKKSYKALVPFAEIKRRYL